MDARIIHRPTLWLWVFSAASYCLLRWGRGVGIPKPELNHALADLLCLPVVLSGIYLFWIFLVKRDPKFRLSFPAILVAFLAVSLVFEWYLPGRSSVYTSDWRDVVFYAFGAGFFYLIHCKESRNRGAQEWG